jgi:uncharacterized Fe-S cluster-containing radical SAM superfamily enzyme
MVQIVTTTTEELKSMIAETVKTEMNKFAGMQNVQPKNEFLTRQQTAEKLHISLSTLDTYTKLGILNAKRMGKRVLYSADDITDSMIDKINSQKNKMKR